MREGKKYGLHYGCHSFTISFYEESDFLFRGKLCRNIELLQKKTEKENFQVVNAF